MRERTIAATPVKRERTRTAANDLSLDFNAVEAQLSTMPRFFVYGGFIYEIVAETGTLITGVDRTPDKVVNGGKTTVGSKLVQILPKDNILARVYHILIERRKLLKSEEELRENLFAIKGVERAVRDLHYLNVKNN